VKRSPFTFMPPAAWCDGAPRRLDLTNAHDRRKAHAHLSRLDCELVYPQEYLALQMALENLFALYAAERKEHHAIAQAAEPGLALDAATWPRIMSIVEAAEDAMLDRVNYRHDPKAHPPVRPRVVVEPDIPALRVLVGAAP
jgi:hypothetical protein